MDKIRLKSLQCMLTVIVYNEYTKQEIESTIMDNMNKIDNWLRTNILKWIFKKRKI